ncbi:NaeI family type II restriction endonuclease [Gryllotalpicola sp.]|uniref:NaeI family type II restriction endonuclease n=1 Tax=Gryllotalpicola sp. TaxID=1932787 RepID=UPI00261D2EA1|nr:NaeI family type II restriction endonuclease [Gryllotalpicola sp.]
MTGDVAAGSEDSGAGAVFDTLLAADPDGRRAAKVFRRSFDQIYDGQHTGRYRWDQLTKTERTYFGTVIEINLRNAFADVVGDGRLLDYRIAGLDVDCKYSQSFGGWMVPPEGVNQILLVCHASDENSEWAMGVVRAVPAILRESVNRDGKTGISTGGRSHIRWLHFGAPMAENVLLHAVPEDQSRIFAKKSGQQRLNEMFRLIQRRVIDRAAVATVAQQDDYMKRARANGGSKTALAREGILVIGGDYSTHREVAAQLGLPVPGAGQFVSARIALADEADPYSVELDGRLWRVAEDSDPTVTAPKLPDHRGSRDT